VSAEEELTAAAAEYRAFMAAGGLRGSHAGRQHRQRISDLVVRVRDERFRAERITEDDEVAAFAHIDVFGE
jgi:hypothetical protein